MRDSGNVQEQVLRFTLPGERLLWSGAAPHGLRFGGSHAFAMLFGLFFFGFAVFWNYNVWTSGAPVGFRLFGLPFLAIGLYMVVGRPLLDAYWRRQMMYLVTNRRIGVIWKSGPQRWSTWSRDIHPPPQMELASGQDGRGTIHFGASGTNHRGLTMESRSLGAGFRGLDGRPQFSNIAGAREVYALIMKQASLT